MCVCVCVSPCVCVFSNPYSCISTVHEQQITCLRERVRRGGLVCSSAVTVCPLGSVCRPCLSLLCGLFWVEVEPSGSSVVGALTSYLLSSPERTQIVENYH